jgi:WD40 repeat protein
VTVGDQDKGRPRLTFQAGDRIVQQLAFTADGKTLLINGTSGIVRQLEVSTGRLRRDLTPAHVAHGGPVYSPARNIVATEGPGGIVLWDLTSGSSQVLPWPNPGATLLGVAAFSPDGSILAGWEDYNVFLCDIASGRALFSLPGHRSRFGTMTFSPDGKTLASLSADGEVKLWSVLTGQEMLSLEDHRGPIRSVAFAPNGRMLATSCAPEGAEEEVHLWLTPDGP